MKKWIGANTNVTSEILEAKRYVCITSRCIGRPNISSVLSVKPPKRSDSHNREDSAGRSRKLDYFPKQCNYSSNDERVSRDDAFREMAMSAIS